jgi:hypothetical protein
MPLLQKPQVKLLKPDLALALTWWSVSLPSSKQTVVGNTTMNLQKFDDGWKIVVSHTSTAEIELRALFSPFFNHPARCDSSWHFHGARRSITLLDPLTALPPRRDSAKGPISLTCLRMRAKETPLNLIQTKERSIRISLGPLSSRKGLCEFDDVNHD